MNLKPLLLCLFLFLASSASGLLIGSRCVNQSYCGDPSIEHFTCESGVCKGSLNNTKCVSGSTTAICAAGLFCNGIGICDVCMAHCDNCVNASYCITCSAGYFLNAVTLKCEAGPGNCTSAQSATICTACNDGFQLSNGYCIAILGNCKSMNVVSKWCSQCASGLLLLGTSCVGGPSNCLIPESTTTCRQCGNGYYLDAPTLTCKYGAYYNGYWCRVPLNATFCLSCYDGTIVFNGLCKSTIWQCQTYIDAATCQACYNGYYLSSGRCYGGPSNCKVATSSSVCEECNSGYYLYGQTCNLGPSNCVVPYNSTVCSTCSNGYYYNGTLCVVGPSNCKTPLSNTVCSVCNGYYYLSSGSCIYGISGCTNVVAEQACSSCMAGYFLNSTYQCVPGPIHCAAPASATLCTRCDDAYFWDGSACAPSPNNCALAVLNDATGLCVWCKTGYYLEVSSNQCKKCTFDNCAACTSSSQCAACESGYYIGPYGNCTKCPMRDCLACSSGNLCDVCTTGLYWNSTVEECMPCKWGCGFCRNIVNCTTCADGYYMGANYTCYACNTGCTCTPSSYCTGCLSGYYYLLSSSECGECSKGCKECRGPDADMCTKCIDGAIIASDGNRTVGSCTCRSGYEFDGNKTGCFETAYGSWIHMGWTMLCIVIAVAVLFQDI